MRRAGLDYREFASVTLHDSFEAYVETNPSRVFAFTQHATTTYTDISYEADDTLLFGRESDGLSETVLNNAAITERVRIPIAKDGRSLNLANAAAIGIYEAWRQHGFR
jgi:tRNA (cytidine/uridine-2'-O-)-methyltransferase